MDRITDPERELNQDPLRARDSGDTAGRSTAYRPGVHPEDHPADQEEDT